MKLVSSNGEYFEVSEYICRHFKTVECFMDEDADTIPIPMVDSSRLKSLIDFFDSRLSFLHELTGNHALDDETSLSDKQRDALTTHCRNLLEDEPIDDLLQSIFAANYLNCPVLLDVISTIIASRIAGKSRDEMRALLGIENDFTPEEEAQVMAENAWALA